MVKVLSASSVAVKFRAIVLPPYSHSNNIFFRSREVLTRLLDKNFSYKWIKGLELSITEKSILVRSYELTLRVLRCSHGLRENARLCAV